MFLLLLFVTCTAYAFWLMARQRRRMKVLDPPALPGKLPLIGHNYLLYGDAIHIWNTLKWVSQESLAKGGVITLNIGPRHCYGITDPDDLYTVANTCLLKDYFYDFSKPLFGNGLFNASGPVWKHHRKLLNPAFNQQVLDGFVAVFNNESRRLVGQLTSQVGKGPFSHLKYLSVSTSETVFQTVFGVNDKYNDLMSEYFNSIEQMHLIITEMFQKLWFHSDMIYNLSNLKATQDEHTKILHRFSNMAFVAAAEVAYIVFHSEVHACGGVVCRVGNFPISWLRRPVAGTCVILVNGFCLWGLVYTVIENRKLQLAKKDFNGPAMDCKNKNRGKFKPILDLLLELANNEEMITDQEIREEVDTFIIAGLDTSSCVLMYTLMTIGSYPQVQEKIYKELQDVLGYSDNDVTRQDLQKLVYLEAVIKETLRLYPIAPIVSRYVHSDVKLKNYTIRAGSSALLLFWGMHHHPIWGSDVEQFNPERWLNSSTLKTNIKLFAGFSLGKRDCIGKTFAMMSMKTTLVHLIRQYRVDADVSKLTLKIDVMLKPASGNVISLNLRRPKNQIDC